MMEVNIWDTFSSTALTRDIDQNPYGVLFDNEKFR
jgi:hypothetical protein